MTLRNHSRGFAHMQVPMQLADVIVFSNPTSRHGSFVRRYDDVSANKYHNIAEFDVLTVP